MLSVYFARRNFTSIAVVQQEEGATRRLSDIVLQTMENSVSLCRPKLRAKDIHLRLDNGKLRPPSSWPILPLVPSFFSNT
jgi:hypothetical protein